MKVQTLRRTAKLMLIPLLVSLSGCGLIMHPERKGQLDGELDVRIVVLDAIGLLFGIIPGAVAFGVDFATGTIFLPGGGQSQLTDDEMSRLVVDNKVQMDVLKEIVEHKAAIELDDEQWAALNLQHFPAANQ